MKNVAARICLVGTVLALASAPSAAAPITDTVIVGDKEWAQVSLFAGVTFDAVASVCAANIYAPCTTGETLNGWDVTGWTWAGNALVGALFSDVSPHPGGAYDLLEADSSWAPTWFDVLGFTSTSVDSSRLTWGWSADWGVDSATRQTYALAPFLRDVGLGATDEANSNYAFDPTGFSYPTLGAWLYRPAPDVPPVPEPATLLLSALGLTQFFVRARRTSRRNAQAR